jgi:rRNA maturation protein Rpf1
VIGLTTGRETTQRLNILLKELVSTIPNSKIIRRGRSSLEELGRRLSNDGIRHAVAIYRWHGGPGRIDLFNVNKIGLEQVPPSILLKSVKLRREYEITERHFCSAITYADVSAATRRFGHAISGIIELPELESADNVACSLHIRNSNREFEAVVTAPGAKREIGPKLVISNLLW